MIQQKKKKIDLFQPGDLYKSYQIVKQLGQGGFAVAYLVKNRYQKNNIRVLKASEISQDNNPQQKIVAQFKIIRSFDHPNIIKVYESYRQQIKKKQYLFIIMEYAQGGDLKVFLGKLTEQEIFKIYHQVKEVIQYIHARGVIHRDLKLENILLDKMKNVKVIDFGIATELEQQITHMETLNKQGTSAYKPIQFLKSCIVSKQNDLWQLGITLIQLATGKNIHQLTNKTLPCLMDNFPQQVFIKQNVNNKFRSIISPLLRKQYKERKFCEEQIIMIKQELKVQQVPKLSLKIKQKQLWHVNEILKNLKEKPTDLEIKFFTALTKAAKAAKFATATKLAATAAFSPPLAMFFVLAILVPKLVCESLDFKQLATSLQNPNLNSLKTFTLFYPYRLGNYIHAEKQICSSLSRLPYLSSVRIIADDISSLDGFKSLGSKLNASKDEEWYGRQTW